MNTAEAIATILRHSEIHCPIHGTVEIAVRPILSDATLTWFASVDVVMSNGVVPWWPCTRGAKTADGAIAALAKEIIAERKAA